VLGVVALVAVLAWAGWLDLSQLPISIPGVAEHCGIRYQGANVIVEYEGPGSTASCTAAASGWLPYSGEPIGALACYGSKGGLHWKVYDTGLMIEASQVCEQLVQ
jgi:hypothetical protein